MNEIRRCLECGGRAIKGDTCYACRTKKKTEKIVTRAETNKMVDVILTESPANALKRVQELQKRVRAGDESCRAELQQAKAILRREVITEETLI